MKKILNLTSFLVLFAGFTAMSAYWVFGNGYINTDSVRLWAEVLMAWESPKFAADHLTLVYPQLRYYLILLFYLVSKNFGLVALYAFTAMFGAVLVMLFYNFLRRNGYNAIMAGIITLLIASHPFFIWSVTRGGGETLALVALYALGTLLMRTRAEPNFAAKVALASMLALYMLLDARFPYLMVGMLPMLVFFAPPKMLIRSPGSYYMITLFPLVVIACTYFYFNWVFGGHPLAFLRDSSSVILGEWENGAEAHWLYSFQGSFFTPLMISFGLAIASCPVAFLGLLWQFGNPSRYLTMLVLLLLPILGISLATVTGFAGHPIVFLFLLLVASVFAFARPNYRPWQTVMLIILLLVGQAGGWVITTFWQNKDLERWYLAIQKNEPVRYMTIWQNWDREKWEENILNKEVDHPFRGEYALGDRLKGLDNVMIDDRVGFPAIVKRGSAEGLILPASDEFKIAVTMDVLEAQYVVVPNPGGPRGFEDQINQNFPTLYDFGYEGYELIYDSQDWRILQRKKDAVEGELASITTRKESE